MLSHLWQKISDVSANLQTRGGYGMGAQSVSGTSVRWFDPETCKRGPHSWLLSDDSGLTAPVACASESAAEYYRTQSRPRQVYEPKLESDPPSGSFSTCKYLAEKRTQTSEPRTRPQNTRTNSQLLQSRKWCLWKDSMSRRNLMKQNGPMSRRFLLIVTTFKIIRLKHIGLMSWMS